MVSHERICQFIREDKKKGGTLYKHLRHRLKHRKRHWPENKSAILTATERTAGFFLMKKLPKGKNAKALAKKLFFRLLPYKQCVLSITFDNGSEFYGYKLIVKYLDANYFFAHPYSSPYSSWERGLNEYTNGLIRQYIPKKQDFKNFIDGDYRMVL